LDPVVFAWKRCPGCWILLSSHIFGMLTGRLEILPVLLIFTLKSWRNQEVIFIYIIIIRVKELIIYYKTGWISGGSINNIYFKRRKKPYSYPGLHFNRAKGQAFSLWKKGEYKGK
jgi:hypothetical protein